MGTDPRVVLTIAYDREEDGRCIAEIPELPGILPVYGATRAEARKNAIALALYWIADRIEEGELGTPDSVEFRAA